jgi:hypothetical protein
MIIKLYEIRIVFKSKNSLHRPKRIFSLINFFSKFIIHKCSIFHDFDIKEKEIKVTTADFLNQAFDSLFAKGEFT